MLARIGPTHILDYRKTIGRCPMIDTVAVIAEANRQWCELI
jgi:hypothetical protein